MIPNQRMPLASNPIGPRPIEYSIGVLVIRLASPLLVGGPIKAQRTVVEQGGKLFPVLPFMFRRIAMTELKEVAAKEKIMAQLLDADRHAGNRSTPGRADGYRPVSFAVFFDLGPCLGKEFGV